ncbi:cytidylyltransferase domain-containing protein, partial [Vibrio parahaemolyticus]|uniref:cytidylyltransferase domain-containing protein n=1 Tax=Vibrio parahaemolyticus TaxID=670 RepID=UPI003F5569C3
LDGFSQFNAGEYQIITSLLQNAKQVIVSLVLDRPYVHHAPEANELFYRSGQVYYRLYQLARHEHVKVRVDNFAKQDKTIANPLMRHIGIYAYRAGCISTYVNWAPSALEQIGCLEQLRVLWYGEKIHVAVAKESPVAGVDTPEDLEAVRAIVAKQA